MNRRAIQYRAQKKWSSIYVTKTVANTRAKFKKKHETKHAVISKHAVKPPHAYPRTHTADTWTCVWIHRKYFLWSFELQTGRNGTETQNIYVNNLGWDNVIYQERANDVFVYIYKFFTFPIKRPVCYCLRQLEQRSPALPICSSKLGPEYQEVSSDTELLVARFSPDRPLVGIQKTSESWKTKHERWIEEEVHNTVY